MKQLSRVWAIVLIIAATLLVYWPALRNGFVWDDTALVLRDPLIRSWFLVPEGFRHFLFLDATASNFYRPIQRLTFVADYHLYGFGWPGGWHLTSILCHAAAAIGLFFVAEKLLALAGIANLGERTRRLWALGVAILWAIHPLHTSAVTYVAGRADLLAALFGFAGLALGLISLENPRRVWLWRVGAACGFALAMLSKESGVTFLLIWLLVLVWRRPAWQDLARWAALIALILGIYCSLRFTAQKTSPPASAPTPVAIRPILAARAFAEYAALVVAPIDLRMERDVSTKPRDTYAATLQNARVREFQTLGGVLLVLGFALWLRFGGRRSPTLTFCLTAFLLAWFPISNLFSLNATVAEHWLYVPSAFLFLAVVLTIHLRAAPATTAPRPRWQLVAAALSLAWIAALAARTFLRQGDWRDQRTFIESTIAAGGDSPRMLMNLANEELVAGRKDQAIALYREALRRTPEQPMIWFGYASALARTGEVAAAREALLRAETSPMLQADCLNLHATLAMHDRSGDPDQLLREALEINPASWPIQKRRIEFLLSRNEADRARSTLVTFLQAHDFRAESWKMLGKILETTGHPTEATTAFREAALRDVRDQESRTALQRLSGKQ